jgi:hypothetical protein
MPRLALAAVLGLALGCVSERRIEDEFEDANYCDSADECVAIYPGCPLGCQRLVNAAEQARVQKLVDRYHRQHRDTCVYDCIGFGPPRCEAGTCVADPL